jgi:hypothetical protein
MNDVEYRHPDPIKHKYISFVKSALRIIAGSCIIAAGYATGEGWLVAGGVLLVGAEILGIVEELV